MAMAALEAQIREMMQCKICFEDKENQKQLPCQHTICLHCLNSLKLTDSHYKCPLCQRETLVPNGGFEALPDSLMTRQLASMIHASEWGLTPSAGQANGASQSAEPPAAEGELNEAEPVQSEIALKLRNGVQKGKERLEVAETKIKDYSKMQENLRTNCEKMEEKIVSLLEEYIVELKASGAKKVEAVKEITEEHIEDVSLKLQKLQEAFDSAQEVVGLLEVKAAELKDDVSEIDVINDVQRAQASLEILQDQIALADTTNGQFKAGDSVRLKIDVDLLKTKFLDSDVDHSSIGYLHSVDSDGDSAVIFAGNSRWVGKTDHLDKSHVKHDLPVVGDRVRVKPSVSEPHFKWGKVKAESVGILKELLNRGPIMGRQIKVDFPEDHDWTGIFDELEKVAAEPLKVDDEVWISKDVAEPARGWAGVTLNSRGTLLSIDENDVVVRFPECEEWKGLLSELERVRPITVGDKVRVLKSVKEPKTGWAGITHNDEGVVKTILNHEEYGQVAGIDFPNRTGIWHCVVSELELVGRMLTPAASSGSSETGNIQINHRQAMQAMHAMSELGSQQCAQQ